MGITGVEMSSKCWGARQLMVGGLEAEGWSLII